MSGVTGLPHSSTTWSIAGLESLQVKVGIGPGGFTTPPVSLLPPFPPQARLAAQSRLAMQVRSRRMSVPAARAGERAHEHVEIAQIDTGAEAVGLQVQVRDTRVGPRRVRAGPEGPGEHRQIET